MPLNRERKMEEKENSRQEHLAGQREMADSYTRSFVRRGKSLGVLTEEMLAAYSIIRYPGMGKITWAGIWTSGMRI